MPTSLTYFIPLARGFSPWRPDAVMSTDRQEVTLMSRILCVCMHAHTHTTATISSVLPGRTFSRDGGSAPDAPEAGALCRSSDPLSGRSDSRVIVLCFRARAHSAAVKPHCAHALVIREDAAKQLAVPLRETVKQEREPSLGPPSPSPGSFALPLSTTLAGHCHNPCPGPGILTWFPFAGRCDALREKGDDVRF